MHTICQMFLEAGILHKFLELEAWKCPCWFACFWLRPFANDIFLVTILFIWTLSCVVDSQNCTQTCQSDRFWHHICGTHPETFINRLSRDSFEKRLEGDWLPGTLTLCWSHCGFMFHGCSLDVPWMFLGYSGLEKSHWYVDRLCVDDACGFLKGRNRCGERRRWWRRWGDHCPNHSSKSRAFVSFDKNQSCANMQHYEFTKCFLLEKKLRWGFQYQWGSS